MANQNQKPLTPADEMNNLFASMQAGQLKIISQLANSGINNTATSNTIPQLITQQPYGDYPDGFDPFDEFGVILLPVVTPNLDVPILSFGVPQGYDGVIKRYHCFFTGGGFVAGDIIWKIKADNTPIKNFDNITTNRGNDTSPREVDAIRIYSGQVISFTVQHLNNVALNGDVTASLAGYLYPSTR